MISTVSFQQTVETKLTPTEQKILDKDIYVLTKIADHLSACKDANCHIRTSLRRTA